ncbi:Hypothetical protein AA314_03618 [Archangium gephyra]|uniref:Uncharacterized protein n=1 Tax=Archangium gephyra TaxID=48 RepID=A0AAC8TDM6_9BACT|nr:Hypothetical protein AA314_03618 [Archangium gephyra]
METSSTFPRLEQVDVAISPGKGNEVLDAVVPAVVPRPGVPIFPVRIRSRDNDSSNSTN